jgi:hypothetical protein
VIRTLLVLQGIGACASPARVLDLPPRPRDAAGGSELAHELTGLDLDVREDRLIEEILAGNVPSWLRTLRPVEMVSEGGTVTVWVTPDYLAVGSDSDYLITPLTPQTAQEIADRLGCSLPTPLVVDAVWAGAPVRLAPLPIPPSPEMTTVPVFARHSEMIRGQRLEARVDATRLTAGHKKDVVVTPDLESLPGRVAIYGWHREDGTPIQPLYLGHTDRWVDYSHGIRLVLRDVRIDGSHRDLWDVLRDPETAESLSRDGVVGTPRYGPRRSDRRE